MLNKCGKTSFLGRRRKRVKGSMEPGWALSHTHAHAHPNWLGHIHKPSQPDSLPLSMTVSPLPYALLRSFFFVDKRHPASFLHALLSCAMQETSKITRGGKKDGGVGTEHYWFNAWVHKLLLTRRRLWS